MQKLLTSSDLCSNVTEIQSLTQLWNKMSHVQRELTLRHVVDSEPINVNNLCKIDELLQLSKQKNAEIRVHALNEWPEAKERTINNFYEQRPFMHQTTAMLVERDLNLHENGKPISTA
ncbi:unnamed protein product [Schistosoma mattheei]|uniref:Uncharacterized protein n=1 Tax=Schistosoma mattheei TaxID=31246 RepID=A0A183PFA2_9TREM|nr:unnamed protein product [Schistosoma mattheei]